MEKIDSHPFNFAAIGLYRDISQQCIDYCHSVRNLDLCIFFSRFFSVKFSVFFIIAESPAVMLYGSVAPQMNVL